MTLGRVQAAAELCLWWSPSQKAPDYMSGGWIPFELEHHLRPHLRMTQPKDRLRRHQSPAKVSPFHRISLCTTAPPL